MPIAAGVHSMSQGFRKGGYVHAFLLVYKNQQTNAEELTLIDTLYDADAQVVIDQIERIGKSVIDLKHIIVTHCHRSHVGGLAELKRRSGATVYSHEWEADIIALEREAQRVRIWPQRPYRAYFPLQFGLALGLGSAGHAGSPPACRVDRTLKGGDRVGPLEVIHTPGHTPGSLSFYWRESRVLFTGDVIVSWPRIEPGWKGFTLNFRQNVESLDHLASYPDVACLAVGHGEPIRQDAARIVRICRDQARNWC